MPNPVVLVHGFASSFQHGWADDGWPDILADEGREVIGFDLLGHGGAPKPADPAAYDALEDYVVEQFGDHPQVDAIGFSLGARLLLSIASRNPERFGRLVVMGVGASLLRSDPAQGEAIARAVESGAGSEDIGLRVFDQMASDPRNDRAALAAVMRRQPPALDPQGLGRISCPVLVIIGSEDFAGPADPLVEALPDARSVVLAGVDHFATPKDFRAIDAALRFLGA